MEFNVVGIGEHRQWVRVTSEGSFILSGHPGRGGDASQLAVSLDESGRPMQFERHEHGFGYRDPDGTIPPLDENNPRQPPHLRIGFVVGSQDQATADAMWAAMVAVAAEINARDLNYNFLFQNSNSVFNTLALVAGLDDHDSGFAPGQNRNLLDVNEENQPFVLSLGQEGFVFGSGGSDIIIGR